MAVGLKNVDTFTNKGLNSIILFHIKYQGNIGNAEDECGLMNGDYRLRFMP